VIVLLLTVVFAVDAIVPRGYVPVPGARYAHSSCIHRVPNYSLITKHEQSWHVRTVDANEYPITRCLHPLIKRPSSAGQQPQHGAAWIVDAMQDNSGGFKLIATNFTIPQPPANTAVLFYIWPGLEDEAMGDVLQPVLQFGSNGQSGGPFWVYQSWFVSGDGTVLTSDVLGPLPPQTALGGSVELSSDGSYYQVLGVAPDMQTVALNVTASESQLQTRAYVTLEIYDIGTDCTKLPPDNQLPFTSIELLGSDMKPVAPAFIKEYQHPTCGSDVLIDDANHEVTITWKAA